MGLKPADAIIVLGAAVWANERPSPSLNRRTRHAIALYQNGLAPLIILSGGLGLHPPTEAEAMAEICRAEGVPPTALVLEDRSISTFENAQFSADALWQRNAQSVIIVSDDFHLPRATMCFRHLGFAVQGSAAPHTTTAGSWHRRIRAQARELAAMPYYRAMLSRRLTRREPEIP